MNILHVTLGDPYLHQGGLNRYCRELVEEEKKLGHNTAIIYPGSFVNSKCPHVKRRASDKFEVFDSLPVPLMMGVSNPRYLMAKNEYNGYRVFFEENSFDVIHIHSIQGFHKEFFLEANIRNIPMLYTTHDYYPICLRCNLITNKGTMCQGKKYSNCTNCNTGYGLSRKKQRILQSNIYQAIKHSFVMNYFRNRELTSHSHDDMKSEVIDENQDYIALKNYYDEILDTFTVIHCNSMGTYEVYRSNLCAHNISKLKINPITHSCLVRKSHVRRNPEKLNVAYFGGMSKHKGYEVFIDAFRNVSKGKSVWNALLLGGDYTNEKEKLENAEYLGYMNLNKIWDIVDLVVVPSLCRETFGFIVLEALCNGIPVICSDLVGSSYLVKNEAFNLTYHHGNTQMLIDLLLKFENTDFYDNTANYINRMNFSYDIKEHTNSMISMYKCSLGKSMRI